MEEVLAELKEKFRASRQFFGTMQVALAITGKELTGEEEEAILAVIEEYSDLQVVSLAGQDKKTQAMLDDAWEKAEHPAQESTPDGQFYKGTLKRGQSLETEHSVIVLGDVNAGAKIFSKKDVIVLGALTGEVHAGMDDTDGHFVCALEFAPEKLKIGGCQYQKKPGKRFLPDSNKKSPKIATLSGGEIMVKPVTKDLLGKITAAKSD